MINSSGSSTIRGLIINRFNSNGILVNGAGATNNVIVGNWIGIDSSGTVAQRNGGGSQILVNQAGSGNRIGGVTVADRNVVSGGGQGIAAGIQILRTNEAVVQGNYVGTNAAGTAAVPNDIGIFLSGTSGCLVGGTTPARAIWSRAMATTAFHSTQDVTPATNNVVEGNFVGTQAGGTGVLGNRLFGINFSTGANNNTAGGTSTAARNVVCNNGAGGVNLIGSGNTIQGNWLGIDAAGNAAGNLLRGIDITGSNNLIGGSRARRREPDCQQHHGWRRRRGDPRHHGHRQPNQPKFDLLQ